MRRATVAKGLAVLALMSAPVVGAVMLSGVPSANPRSGSPPTVVAPGFELRILARGTDVLENPSGPITFFGFLNDGPLFAPPTPPPPAGTPPEATKTEPDENLYLKLPHNPGGPTPNYDYGRRFLFQGHENANGLAYVTRINLDVDDPQHRITLLTPVDPLTGKTGFARIDGSTFDPFSKTLLFTQENGNVGGVIQISMDWPPVVQTLYGSLGQGGYEGIHPDDQGNLYIAEDVGGTSVNINPADPASPKAAKNPNSFVYRFIPKDPADLTQGKLQALQVTINGSVSNFIKVDAAHPTGDVFSDNQLLLHTPGTHWPVKWVTIHDTDVDGTAAFDANAAAKSHGATPFKRPENLQFLPGSRFRTFYFCPTGDTDQRAGTVPALADRGAWGSIFRVEMDSTRNAGQISIFVLGTDERAAFDNLAFGIDNVLYVTEDRGELLHTQLNTLDSIWAFNTHALNPHGDRFVALGRDMASALDAAYGDFLAGGGVFPPGFSFQNDTDNEPTGLHISDGSPTAEGLLGHHFISGDARFFFTQQHGLNQVFEVRRKRFHEED